MNADSDSDVLSDLANTIDKGLVPYGWVPARLRSIADRMQERIDEEFPGGKKPDSSTSRRAVQMCVCPSFSGGLAETYVLFDDDTVWVHGRNGWHKLPDIPEYWVEATG